jgi:hypothetical protein
VGGKGGGARGGCGRGRADAKEIDLVPFEALARRSRKGLDRACECGPRDGAQHRLCDVGKLRRPAARPRSRCPELTSNHRAAETCTLALKQLRRTICRRLRLNVVTSAKNDPEAKLPDPCALLPSPPGPLNGQKHACRSSRSRTKSIGAGAEHHEERLFARGCRCGVLNAIDFRRLNDVTGALSLQNCRPKTWAQLLREQWFEVTSCHRRQKVVTSSRNHSCHYDFLRPG